MAKNIHIVPHMHWDREWYFTTEESRILLVNNMEEIMDMLEQNEAYPYYVLDGQTAILEDYFAVKPENRERVKKLVQAGKLIIGPWYTQTDEMVVGGESIVRNLLYGLKDSREFGEPMLIGYLPDSFGQSEKMPQILNGFGIKRAIFWRGSSERHGTDKQNFIWKSSSEGEVVVQLLPLGYAIGKYLPTEAEALKARMEKYLPVLDKGTVNDEILLPNGHDQMPVQKNIFEVIKTLKSLYPERDFFLSRYEHLFEELEKQPKLDVIQGELLDGKYMRVHRSIFSGRADLKASNTRIENKITNSLEPLAAIAYSLGASYEEGLIEAIWKELMKNHAHDSIGCCCSDKVHRAIANRFFIAEDKTDELIRFYQRKIVDAMSCEEALDKLTVFNLLTYDRDEVVEGSIITKEKNFELVDGAGRKLEYELLDKEIVDAGLIDRQIVHYGDYDPFVKYRVVFKDVIPAMGYKTYLIKPLEGERALCKTEDSVGEAENEFYHIKIEKNGSLTILQKLTGQIYKNVMLVEDGSDDGDEYDFSPLQDDYIILSDKSSATVKRQTGVNKTCLNVSYEMQIPKNLESRKAKICDSAMRVEYRIELKKNSPIIGLKIHINNQSKDHRVRLLIPNNLKAQYSISDNQFGQIKRAVVDDAMRVWEKEKWHERPDAIYPMLSYVGLEESGLSVLTNSVREFEVIGETDSTIAITLFRCVGYLGKEEMLRRPGRPSGIKMATPDSQMLGDQRFELALSGTGKIEKYAKEYTTPLISYNKMSHDAMKLNTPAFQAPYDYSLLRIAEDEFVLSAFKKAQGKEAMILRGYQVAVNNLQMSLEVSKDYCVTGETNLNEDMTVNFENATTASLPANVAKTFLLEVHK